jgi:hypothetical protein
MLVSHGQSAIAKLGALEPCMAAKGVCEWKCSLTTGHERSGDLAWWLKYHGHCWECLGVCSLDWGVFHRAAALSVQCRCVGLAARALATVLVVDLAQRHVMACAVGRKSNVTIPTATTALHALANCPHDRPH